jgi:phosphinothricin acetyltransferase
MPEPFRLRDANRLDVSEITAIYRPEVETGLSSWEEVPPGETEMAGRMQKIQSAGLPYLVAERSGRVVGYSYADRYHPRQAYRYTLEDTVYVEPRSQGQGIGRALLEEVLRRCEAAGYRQMMAFIHWVPGSPSLALHERLGFRLIGIGHGLGYKLGAWRDLALMQLPLGPGSATEPGLLAGTKDRLAVGP